MTCKIYKFFCVPVVPTVQTKAREREKNREKEKRRRNYMLYGFPLLFWKIGFHAVPFDCFIHFLLASMKVKPYANDSRKEGATKDDQLSLDVSCLNLKDEISKDIRNNGNQAQTFTFEELVAATDNFRSDCFLGEGGFGKVYKGCLEKINQVDIPPNRQPLDWNARMKIAAGAARGLEYLHNQMTPPVIYHIYSFGVVLLELITGRKAIDQTKERSEQNLVAWLPDQTSSACLGGSDDTIVNYMLHFSCLSYQIHILNLPAVVNNSPLDGFTVALPPFIKTSCLDCSIMYDFNCSREKTSGKFLARPMFKDRRNFSHMVDPFLQGQYPIKGLYQALAIAAMCVQEQPNMRPAVSDVVMALNYLASNKYDPQIHPVQDPRRRPSHPCSDKDDGRA
ncbi:hypothetical protein SADUNF_Sadunf16G0126600 [Salix dunnii]|uniref:Protein kinase domain-containing protein n=1 Tax=Salix dunnii TaxID=1413687 RepID=A0A835J8D1_9ROSI|nr:hypothetical protein SADUNF_Sadunf16G0126600 [Salix dunnii]